MKQNIIFLLIGIVFFLSGCDTQKIQKLDPKLLESPLGTLDTKEQKLITKLPIKEEPPKIVQPKKKKAPTMSVSAKKERFKTVLVPIVTEVYSQLQGQFEAVQRDIQNNQNHQYIEELKEFYEVETNEDLLKALKPHPISITLAQGAIESAWLTSRFTKLANNIFGVWSFRSNEPRIEASGTRGEKKIYLKKYKNLKAAVYDYYKNIGKNWAYEEFRKQRLLTDDPYVLVDHLKTYSEKREVYTQTLKKMIKFNQFDQYDIKSIP